MAHRLTALLVRLYDAERRREPMTAAALRDAVMLINAEFDALAARVSVAERVAEEPDGCVCGTGNETLETVKRRHCERAIRVYGGVANASKVLGVPQATLYRWHRRWSGIEASPAPTK